MRDLLPTRGLPTALLSSLVIFLPLFLNAEETNYERDIKPLLAEKCVACHGPVRQESGLRLDAAALIRKGGDSGPAAVSGKPDDSGLIARVTSDSEFDRMPPFEEGEALSAEQIGHLKRWIAAGMPAPADEPILEGPGDHWAYQPIVRPDLPEEPHSSGANPIDRILGTASQAQDLKTIKHAEPAILLRRVTMDLVGLPPTLEEQEHFLNDESPDRYRKLVDRLLASPAHGERWGRHWMDVWRYSDWDGYKDEVRGSQRHIWHWRDWIIESINADKGYDRMITEMLAGDEIAPLDPDVLRATGFLARNYHSSNRDIWLDATVEHTAKAFLGMTVACARCHDHKYDPIAQTDYYRFRAIFEPHQARTDRIPGQPNLDVNGLPRAYDAALEAKTFLYERGDERHPDKEHPLSPGMVELFGLPFEPVPVELPVLAFAPSLVPTVVAEDRTAIETRLVAARDKADATTTMPVSTGDTGPVMAIRPTPAARLAALEMAAVTAELVSFDARVAADRAKFGLSDEPKEELAKTATNAERQYKITLAEQSLVQAKQTLEKARSSEEKDAAKKKQAIAAAEKALGEAEKKLTEARQALASDKIEYSPVGKQYPKTSTGRRLALAQWITHERNPLAARVAVNHIWMRHFGTPLVEHVYDFGLQSPQPLHANLLDWLAAEFIESGWSMKHIHRLIVTSQTYQRTSSLTGEVVAHNMAIDPENAYFWHAVPRRLEAEIVRDSMIAVAGKLVRQGGPDIDFSRGEEVYLRSLYFRHAYEKQMKMLTIFDAASPNECYRRKASILPQQALALANSRLGFDMSKALAARLTEQLGDSTSNDENYIDALFRAALCRAPSAAERAACVTFLNRASATEAETVERADESEEPTEFVAFSADPEQRAREQLAHVLMNHNDFITVR